MRELITFKAKVNHVHTSDDNLYMVTLAVTAPEGVVPPTCPGCEVPTTFYPPLELRCAVAGETGRALASHFGEDLEIQVRVKSEGA